MKRITLTSKGKAVLAAAALSLFKMFSSEFPAFLQGVVDGWKHIDDVELRQNVFYKYGRSLGGRFRKSEEKKSAIIHTDPGMRRVVPCWTVRQAGMVHAILKRHIEKEYSDGMKPKGSAEAMGVIAGELERAIGASQS